MDVAAISTGNSGFSISDFRSPRRVLVRSFERSREKWKAKAIERKREIKRLSNHAYKLKRARKGLEERVAQLEQELDKSRNHVTELEQKLVVAEKKMGTA